MEFMTTDQTRDRGGRRFVTVCHELRKVRSQHCCAEITASEDGVNIQGWPTMRPDEAMEFAAQVLIAAAQADEIICDRGDQVVADMAVDPC